MITLLEFTKRVRCIIETNDEECLCVASAAVRRPYMWLRHEPEVRALESVFDGKVKGLAAEFGGDINCLFFWPLDEGGQLSRLAVCDHIIDELSEVAG